MTVPPRRAASGGWLARVLRTPLLTKLILLDLFVNAIAFLVVQWTPPEVTKQVTVGSLALVLLVNAALVAIALRPLGVLEETARRVSDGEFGARAVLPPFADRNLARIAQTLNLLIERVHTDRQRVRALASEVVAAGDRERAHIARELHDGTAQSLSALDMLLATTLAEPLDEDLRERLSLMRQVASEALGEVRALSHNVHPRVLDDLGLPAALQHLVRRVAAPAGIEVAVACSGDRDLPQAVTSVLYRVAQEALHNAAKHGRARNVQVELALGDRQAELVVQDDGVGFDRAAVEADRGGIGLFVMEERVLLVGGRFTIVSATGAGTRVQVQIPLPGRGASERPALSAVAARA
jgi:signal transduction histidine kinase